MSSFLEMYIIYMYLNMNFISNFNNVNIKIFATALSSKECLNVIKWANEIRCTDVNKLINIIFLN